MKNIFIYLIFLISLISCSKSIRETLEPDFTGTAIVPLAVGNYWKYIDSSLDMEGFHWLTDTTLLTISGKKIINYEGGDVEIFLWTWIEPSLPDLSMLTRNYSNGLYFFGGSMNHNDIIRTKSLHYKFPVVPKERWYYTSYAWFIDDSTAFLSEQNFETMKCIDTNLVFKTPGGDFRCYVYESDRHGWIELKNAFSGLSQPFVPTYGIVWEYFKPGLGQIGTIESRDGQIIFKRTLIDYHLEGK